MTNGQTHGRTDRREVGNSYLDYVNVNRARTTFLAKMCRKTLVSTREHDDHEFPITTYVE